MSNQKQKLIDTLATPVVTGAAAAIGCYAVHGSGIIPMFGFNVPATLGFGAVAFASSMLGGVLFNYAAPHIPGNLRTAEAEKLIAKPLLVGASTYGLLKATVSVNDDKFGVDFAPNFAIGAVSELVGQQSSNAMKSTLKKYV